MTKPEIIQRLSDLKPLVGKTDKVAIDEAIALLSAAQLLSSNASAIDLLKGLIELNDKMIAKIKGDLLPDADERLKCFNAGAMTMLLARNRSYRSLLLEAIDS